MSTQLQPITSFASGSVGATVFARNQHGPYTRARTAPTDPNTLRQQRYRLRWRLAAQAWQTDTTPDQRQAWTTYADNARRQSQAARTTHLSGQQAFMRANISRQVVAFGFVFDPPTIFTTPTFSHPSLTQIPAPGFVRMVFGNTDTWAADPDGALVVFIGHARTANTNFYAGPFRRGIIVRGQTPIPPVVPKLFVDPWGAESPPNKWFRALVFRGDGRVSSPIILPFADNL